MADLVSVTIDVITACINTYTDFCAFKEECETFRQSLANVVEVLEDVEKGLSKSSMLNGRSSRKGSSSSSSSMTASVSSSGGTGGATTTSNNTKLRRPMELLRAATSDGGEVLKRCSAKRTLLAAVFSRQLLGTLNKAKADIEEAMRLLQVSSVNIQVSTRRMMDNLSERLDELHQQIHAGYSTPNAVADLVRAELNVQRNTHHHDASAVAAAVSDALLKMGIVSSPQDCAEQFAELQREAERIRQAKVIYDEEMLEAVKALTAPKDNESFSNRAAPHRQVSKRTSAVQECLVCPISGEVMNDPVTVVESGLTYDRKSLCASLLLYPDLEPATGQRFDEPLHYIPNYAVRNLVTAQHGESAYQKYDDTDFKAQYDAKWKEHIQPVPVSTPPLVADKKDWESRGADDEVKGNESWTGLDALSIYTEPTTATSRESGSRSGHGSFDSPAGRIRDVTADIVVAPFGESYDRSLSSPDVAALVEVNIVSSERNDGDDEEAVKSAPVIQPSGKTSCCDWRSRRGKMLIVGAALVVVIIVVVVGVVVGASKPSPVAPTIIDEFNATLPSYTKTSIQYSYSPQSRAYEWVTKYDQVPETDEGSNEEARVFRMTQRFALATLFLSIKGLESWVQPTESECAWGNGAVSCTIGSKVTAIIISNSSSVEGGTLPPEVGLLTNLDKMVLTSLSLESSIPTELGQLSALTHLDLYDNSLTSSIPTELGDLTALTGLGVSANNLTSTIPTELGKLLDLNQLVLSANALTSSIPTELGRLSKLTILNLYSNALASRIPPALSKLSDLTGLSLAENRFTSSVPSELGLLTALTDLILYSNRLTLSIPNELGRLTALRNLLIHENSLRSTIPTELGQLSALTILTLYSNFLTSTIPSELGRLSALEVLYVYNNTLTSTIPTELGRLRNLAALSLQDNSLIGTFPSDLCYIGPYNGTNGVGIIVDCSEVSCASTCCGCVR